MDRSKVRAALRLALRKGKGNHTARGLLDLPNQHRDVRELLSKLGVFGFDVAKFVLQLHRSELCVVPMLSGSIKGGFKSITVGLDRFVVVLELNVLRVKGIVLVLNTVTLGTKVVDSLVKPMVFVADLLDFFSEFVDLSPELWEFLCQGRSLNHRIANTGKHVLNDAHIFTVCRDGAYIGSLFHRSPLSVNSG
jgi:hypothetical protein